MNILHITTYLQGGAGKVIKDIVSYQKDEGNNVFVITTLSEEPGYCNYKEYLDYFSQHHIKCFKIDSTFKRDIYLNLKVADEVKKIIINEDIDIIHAHAAVPAMVGIIARSGLKKYVPVIQTMHGWGTNKRPEHEKMDVTIMNSIDKIISVSKSDKELMISKGILKDKITTIYNGIEKENICVVDNELINDIEKYKSKGYIILGSIGSVCKRKNQQLLIEALNKLPSNTKIFVAFIGEGDMIFEIQKKVQAYGLEDKVKFYGYRDKASSYIKLFDYFIFTSMSEGFSIALLEGVREKVPVIASDIPAFCECIENNVTGYLFENNNCDSLKSVIENVVLNDSINNRKIIENAYSKFKNEFTLGKILKEYECLYNILINEFK